MNFKLTPILIATVVLGVTIFALSSWTKRADTFPGLEEEAGIITLPFADRGDLFYYPIEDECQERMEDYLETSQYNTCEVITSKVGNTTKECQTDSFSVGGCSICKLKCE